MNELKFPHSQRGHLHLGNIVDSLKSTGTQFVNRIVSLLKVDTTENDLNMLTYMLTYFPESKLPPTNQRSRAKDEWAIKIKEFSQEGPFSSGSVEGLLKELYQSRYIEFWSNGDDFSHYRLEAMFQGRRLVVVFYNSSDSMRNKSTFEALLQKNELIRVCWY